MKANIKWEVKINESDYFIEFVEMNFMGKITLSVNGEITKYTPTQRKGEGFWVLFNCGRQECLLKINNDKKSAEVFVDGKSVSENPVIEVAEAENKQGYNPFESVELNRKVRNGTGSFLSIIALSIVNIFLMLFEAPISFPFSLFSSSLALGMGVGLTQEFGGVLIMIVSLSIVAAMIAFYTILYYFSIRSMIAIWISFAFLILDTAGLVVFGLMSQDIASILIDIAFHAWILWSILQLGLAKGKLTKITLEKIDNHKQNFENTTLELTDNV